MASVIEIGASPEGRQSLALKRANRHGLIAGATGTGKTVTLQVLAEAFAREGVNVFAADIKGDLSGIAAAGDPPPPWASARAEEIGMPIAPEAAPVVFWDVYGELGHPVRTTITEMGPVLMGRVLEATSAQEGALTIAFKMADDRIRNGRNEKEKSSGILHDLSDLRALLSDMAENAEEIGRTYGLVTLQTIGTLQRRLLQLEVDGADRFFSHPPLELDDLLLPGSDGRGVVHLLAAERLVQTPRLYSAFLLWLMSELWEELPEVGDQEKPKLVFFFDEAHLLFRDAPKELVSRVEQVVRLIRSKGVGIYFVTQSPADIPEIILSQLGNRIQHALRAYTPSDQKAIRAAAQSFRANPGVDVAREIQELSVGEALISTLADDGAPTPVARTKVRPPNSQVGPLLLATRTALMRTSAFSDKYSEADDIQSAHESRERRVRKAEKIAKSEAKAVPKTGGNTRGARAISTRSSAPRIVIRSRDARNILERLMDTLERGILGTPRRRRHRRQ